MTAGRPRIVLASPRPPPVGGIASWTEGVLASPLAERFALEPFDTAPRDAGDLPSRSRLRVDRALRAGALVARFARLLRRVRPEVVHVSTSYHWALARDGLLLELARAGGARTVLHLHGGDVAEFVGACPRPVRAAVVALLRRADRVVAVTEGVRAYLADGLGLAHAVLLPNFVDVDALATETRSDRGAAPDRLLEVVFVGAVIEAKGVLDLLDAARALPEARFTLAGPPDEALLPSLRARAAALGTRLTLPGALPHADVRALLRRADVFVLPSRREGLPIALLEAMAAGLPCVATRVGGIPDVVRDGEEALLVPPGDVAALEAALRRLAGDSALRRTLGERARRRVELAFAREPVLERLSALWTELALRRRP